MFTGLTEKIRNALGVFASKKHLTEGDVQEASRKVRLALLDADVSYGVAGQLIKKIKAKAVGGGKLKGVNASEQFIHIVHQELVSLMGSEPPKLHLQHKPTRIMLCGLQGAGKTTQCGKLALHFKKKHDKKTLLVACDLQRPAAIDQLRILAEQIDVPFFTILGEKDPVTVARQAIQKAKELQCDTLIFDTAGRLHIDKELMDQLVQMKGVIDPHEVLFVASAAMGQDAVNTAKAFHTAVGITGTILTMLDSSARAGAAISILEVTEKPLVFEGVGEKLEDLQPFHPVSMADRILGMGDVINLVDKMQAQFDDEQAQDLEEKIRKASFTYKDFLGQLKAMKKMGSFSSLLKMVPGMGKLDMGNFANAQTDMLKAEAIILSMTEKERCGLITLDHQRKTRIAKGSGTQLADVNRLVKAWKKAKQFSKLIPKDLSKLASKGLPPGF